MKVQIIGGETKPKLTFGDVKPGQWFTQCAGRVWFRLPESPHGNAVFTDGAIGAFADCDPIDAIHENAREFVFLDGPPAAVFVETGRGCPQKGEWFLNSHGNPEQAGGDWEASASILRRVEVER